MYKFIKIRHDIIKQCHGNYKEMKKLGVLRGSFQGFGCPKRHPDALLAKTMYNEASVAHWCDNVTVGHPW